MPLQTPDIKENIPGKISRSRVKNRSIFLRLLFLMLLFLLVLTAVLYGLNPDKGKLYLNKAKDTAQQQLQDIQKRMPSVLTVEKTAVTEETAEEETAEKKISPEETGEVQTSEETTTPQQAGEQLDTFYKKLDAQPWMKQFQTGETSRQHFSRLIQKLVDNPPAVVKETDDLYTLLKNTAHFFRILGGNNIAMLKGILDREKGNLEDMLHSFYLLTRQPDLLQKEYDITLDQASLRDYASFLLNTMGGQLYLFRRDATSRMLVTFYAIKIIDQANIDGKNPYGIDIRPALERLTDEMDHSGNQLKYRNRYFEELHRLQEKYEQHPDGKP
ncbi:hypothetical protein JWG39_09035 [Desulforhopalus vacuolatus]|uniref:hypothetical protein n=1 Tax=Desulforhopalus vacuolatus TaxID=40414 RepID=UPI0019650E75|nr:hypothetical protein [Desulforhopalus vacuolatus]MBM9519960.1 hypothetical protein [Desulforhopalus vacuolatus]